MYMRTFTTIFAVSLVALLTSVVAAKPTVVVSIHPYYDLTRQIAGDHAEVMRVLPPGASPHTFDPTPRDVARIAGADLVVVNGGYGVDGWLLELVEATGVAAPITNIFDELDFRQVQSELYEAGAARDAEEREASRYAPINSHLWLDPLLLIDVVAIISEALQEVDGANAEAYQANAAQLIGELESLHADLSEMLEPLRGAAFVPFHDAWPYFAERYGLNLVVEIEPFPGREPSPSYIQYALALIEDTGAKAIFTEPQLPKRPAEVVAENAGLPLYTIDPLGGTAEAGSYVELMLSNARTLLKALSE